MFQNTSPLELGWTLTATVGSLAWYLFLALVLRDEVRRRRTGVNGMVKLDITKGIVAGAILGTKSAGYAVAGLLAMQIPPNPSPDGAVSLLPLIFIVNNVALTLLAVYFLVNREQTNREMDRGVTLMRRASDRPAPTRPAPPVP